MLKKQTHYDVIVIGAGPAGFASAVRCAQLGLKTACIDNKRDKNNLGRLGGSHLNTGGVASMTLLDSAKLYYQITHEAATHGIRAENISIDMPKVIGRKDKIIEDISLKMVGLFAHHKVDHIIAKARLLSDRQVEITTEDTHLKSSLSATHIVLASGSKPIKYPKNWQLLVLE